MMDNIVELSKLSKDDNKRLIINDRFYCEMEDGSGIVFSDKVKEDNCPRQSRYADLVIYDDKSFGKSYGKLIIQCDEDLKDQLSMTLYLKDNLESLSFDRSFSVQKCDVEDTRILVNDFMKLINDIPLYPIKEPYEACGLEVCQFAECNKHFPHIEFGIDGRLYYEVVDETNYNEGEVIPLDSDMRKDVISYVKITKENMEELAEKINASLAKLYN